jgi:hypothetical protein
MQEVSRLSLTKCHSFKYKRIGQISRYGNASTDTLINRNTPGEPLACISLNVCKQCCDSIPSETIYRGTLWGSCSQLYILLQKICSTYALPLWVLLGCGGFPGPPELSYLPFLSSKLLLIFLKCLTQN